MVLSLEQVKDAATRLPFSERAELAQFLLQSLEPQEDGWADAWRDELTRRLEEIRTGQVVGIPAEEVLGRLRERYS